MKKVLMYLVPIALICAVLFFVTSKPASQESISQVFAFGDSYSDNNQAKEISTAITALDDHPEAAYVKPSDELYWQNRYSNGKTAVEVLTDHIGVKLTNYATGGGTTGEANYSDWMDVLGNTGVLGQIEKFKASLNGEKADPEALYFIFASGNDYFKFVDYELEGNIEDVADTAVSNIQVAVRRLSELGAKKFFVVSSTDLSLVPYEITTKRTETAKAFVNRINSTIEEPMMKLKDELNVSLILFNPTTVSDKVIANPSEFGIKVLDTPCQSTYPEVKPVKENPDEYYFWDEWHFTKVFHKLLGDAMFDKLNLAK